MRINENTEVVGRNITLVPYDEDLVPKYHEWMTSQELLNATASEPLSLEEEFQMQKSWRADGDKLTFIIVDKEKRGDGDVAAMIGDTNLFLGEPGVAEVMIMIAEVAYRRRGYGKEALLLLLRYGIETLGIERYDAKISCENTPSIKMFESVGFVATSESQVFNEVTLTKEVSQKWRETLNAVPYVTYDRASS